MALQPLWDKGWVWGILLTALTIGGVLYDRVALWPAFVIPAAAYLLFMAYVETQKAK